MRRHAPSVGLKQGGEVSGAAAASPPCGVSGLAGTSAFRYKTNGPATLPLNPLISTPVQAWLLLVHNGQGSAHEVTLRVLPGREVAKAEELALSLVRYNGQPADASTHASALCGLRMLARTFKDEASFTPQSLSGWHFNTGSGASNITGQSDQLLLAMCTFLAGLARLEGKVRGARTQASGPFAATGTIDAQGWVGPVEHVPAKLEAAIADLPEGCMIFVPTANWAEVTIKHRRDAESRGSRIKQVAHISEALQALGVSANAFWNDAPWRALGEYKLQHHPIYFGRSTKVREFVNKLLDAAARSDPLDQLRPGGLVVAASGTGKSSFVQAGVLAHLRNLPEVPHQPLQYAVWRPRDALREGTREPDESAVASSILRNWATRDEANAAGFVGLEEGAPAENLRALGERFAQALRPGWRHVWVVDQLEELFTLGFTRELRIAFAGLLSHLQRLGVWVIATLRTEYQPDYQQLLDDERRPVLMDVFRGQPFDLPPLTNADLHDVIQGPAAVAGLSFSQAEDKDQPPLDRVIFAAAAQGDSAPLLGFAMHEVWSNACKAVEARGEIGLPRELSFGDFRQLGDGIYGVLGRVAEKALEPLEPAAQAELPRLLESLSTIVTTEGTARETSRPCGLDEWRRGTPGGQLVQGLKAAGLLLYEDGKVGSETRIRVAHELLFVHWDRARTLLLELRKTRPFLDYLKTQSAKWELTGKKADLLTSESDLDEAEAATFRELFVQRPDRADLLRYVDLSLRARQWRRRLRLVRNTAAVAGIAGLALAMILHQQKSSEAAREGEARSLLEAQQWIQVGNYARAIDTVLESMEARHAPQPRPAEEAILLRALLMKRPERVLREREDNPNPAIGEISADGLRLLTAPIGGNARLRDLSVATNSHDLLDAEPLEMAAFLGKSTHVLTATSTSLKMWPSTGAEPFSYAKGKDERVLAIGKNGSQVLLGAPRAARVFDLTTARELVLPITETIKAAAFDSKGEQVLVSDAVGKATLWRLSGPRPRALEVANNPDGVNGEQVAFSPDDQWLAAGFDNRSIQVCRVLEAPARCHRVEVARPDAMAAPFPSVPYRQLRLAFSPDSTRLYALIYPPAKGQDKLSLSQGQARAELEPGESGLGAWKLQWPQGPQLLGMVGLPRQPTQMALNSSGDRIVLAGYSPTVQVLDLNMPVWEATNVVVFQPNKRLLRMFANARLGEVAFLASDGQIASWDPEPRYPRRVLVDPKGEPINAFSFHRDGKGLWTRNSKDQLRHWSLSYELGELVPHELASSTSRSAAESLTRQPTCPLSADAEAARPHLKNAAGVRCLAESSDRRLVATADELNRIHLWLREGSTGGVDSIALLGHTGPITHLAFSPDGRRLLSSSADGTARLWMLGDIAPEAVVLEGHNGAVIRSDFAPTGDLVGTLSTDGQLRIWRTPSDGRLVQLARLAVAKR